MKEDIRKILEIAISAPSGDNSQPWRLEVEDLDIRLYIDKKKDESVYNFNQVASHIAIGTLIENIIIASSNFGYKADLKFFPDHSNEDWVATISLLKSDIKSDQLFESIKIRRNNRKPFSTEKIKKEIIDKILEEADAFPEVELKIVEDSDLINSIAKAGSKNEKLVLENKNLHHFLFKHVVWTDDEAKKGMGMHIKTLEMPAPAELIFKACSNWSIMKKLAKIGLPTLISKQNQQIYMRAGAYGALVLKHDGPKDIVQMGRLLERVWLRVTDFGLSFNAMAGLVILNYRLNNESESVFNREEADLIRKSYEYMATAFSIKEDEFISFVFRIGKSGPASGNSYRLPIDKVAIFK